MKVVFLDFDGVLNQGHGPGHPNMVRNLNKVTRRTGAGIVVHSSWRYGRSVPTLRTILADWGVKGEVIDAAPVPQEVETRSGSICITTESALAFMQGLPEEFRRVESLWEYERACAIQLWLDHHGKDVTHFVILDDHDNFAHLGSKHVRTKLNVGLTPEQADKAIRILGGAG